MTEWEVSTTEKKNVEEHELWQKGDMVIRRITGFRWGTFIVTTDNDEKPDLELSDAPWGPCVNMWECGYESELEIMDDGWFSQIIWPDDMPEEECDRLESLWDEDSYEGWEEEGWIQYETQAWFSGALEIKKLNANT